MRLHRRRVIRSSQSRRDSTDQSQFAKHYYLRSTRPVSFCKQNSVSDRQLQFRDSPVLYSQLRFNTIDEGLFKRWDNRNVIASPRSHWIPIHYPKPATVHLHPFTSTSRQTAFVLWKSSYRVRERQFWKFKFLFLASLLCQTPFLP